MNFQKCGIILHKYKESSPQDRWEFILIQIFILNKA